MSSRLLLHQPKQNVLLSSKDPDQDIKVNPDGFPRSRRAGYSCSTEWEQFEVRQSMGFYFPGDADSVNER